jgi:hypothetical protein
MHEASDTSEITSYRLRKDYNKEKRVAISCFTSLAQYGLKSFSLIMVMHAVEDCAENVNGIILLLLSLLS